MFEHETEEVILQRMLDRIPNTLDKRVGSLIYNAIAPAANEMARMYNDLDRYILYTIINPDMPDEYLDLKIGEFGLYRNEATYPVKKAIFYGQNESLIDVPIDSRFVVDDYFFHVIEKLSVGVYRVQCEVLGIAGNTVIGTMIPVEYIEGLVKGEIVELLIPGEEKESNESYYNRYLDYINEKAFGGNVAAYKDVLNDIDGIGVGKVFPVWNGGGTVKLVLLDSDYNPPTNELINSIQTYIDPVQNHGSGLGIAPVGHTVTVKGADIIKISISTKLVLKNKITVGQLQEEIEGVIQSYLLELRKIWDSEDYLVVRISQIEAKILTIDGITDISDTAINGKEENLALLVEEVPILEVVNVSV